MRAATVRIWALHVVANAALVAGVYSWLSIGDSTALRLVATALFGLLLAVFAVWLHGIPFAHFREPDLSVVQACKASLKRLLPLLGVAVLAAAVYWFLQWVLGHADSPANSIASWLTLHLRKPIHPQWILSIITWKIRILEWIVVPILLLPLAAGSFARLRDWKFWIVCPVLVVLAIYVPWRLLHWVPYQGGLALEMTSFIARWLFAWLLFVTAWFALVAITCGRKLWVRKAAAVSE